MAQLIASFTPALIGLLFTSWLASGAYRKLFYVRGAASDALTFVSLAAIVVALLIIAPWFFSSLWLRYVIAAGLAAATLRFLLSFRRTPSGEAGLAVRFTQSFIAMLGVMFALAAALGAAGFAIPAAAPAPVELAFPLKGRAFVVGQGGASLLLNYHHGSVSQAYALDILAANALGWRADR